jgi:5-formyltetrahydrofolate cyclo-ligase
LDFGAPPADWERLRNWREHARQKLLAQRQQMRSYTRRARGEIAKRRLQECVALSSFSSLGIYWPIRAEIDFRDVGTRYAQAGGQLGLPVALDRSRSMEFWSWQPGASMARGLWNIPIPETCDPMVPAALIVPLLGFDADGYRLGYGSGFYDRWLAQSKPQPFCIGLAYDDAFLPTIRPQAHDVAMDMIVTDVRVMTRDRAKNTVSWDPGVCGRYGLP